MAKKEKEFRDVLEKVRGKDFEAPKVLLCLDPGHTTGTAIFYNGTTVECLQVETITTHNKKNIIHWESVVDMFERIQPTMVVCENYRVYQHKLDQHTNSSVDTLRLIGGIDMYCKLHQIPIVYQMASQAKGFCTDNKLKAWQLWQTGQRHSRDAVRHGVYYLLFNKEEL